MSPNARFAPGHEQLMPGACGVYLQKRDAPAPGIQTACGKIGQLLNTSLQPAAESSEKG